MKFLDRLFDVFMMPEELALLRDRVAALEKKAVDYHVREPKVFVVADANKQPKMRVK